MMAGRLACAAQLFEAVQPHMGTLVRIKLYAPDQISADAAFRAAFDRIRQIDETLSDYKPDSELNRLTGAQAGHPVRISEDLFTVLASAQKLAEESAGAFDITVGPLTYLWRAARKQGNPPSATAIQEAVERCGYAKLHLDRASRTAWLDQAGMQLDAGGIGKGYAADAALQVITKLGIRSALVAASGDLAFSDAPPGQRGWKIGLDLADMPDSEFTRVLELKNAAVSTSGDSEQRLDAEGTRYSHIIDPATGIGLTRDIRVTIIAPHGIDADGLSTAVSVLGADHGLKLVERYPDVKAIVLESGRLHLLRVH